MKLSLVVLTPGKGEGKVIPVTLSQFIIGRDPQCHLRPASAVISKRHCALLVRDGKVFLRDFDSTNGTFLNEEPVKGEVELHHDDQLKVGPLLFAVKVEAATAVDKPTPMPPTKAPARPAAAPTRPAAAKAPSAEAKAAPKPPAQQPPPAAPKPAAVSSAASDEDDIAAMLLSLQEDGETPVGSSISSGDVPDGSTVMDIPTPFQAPPEETEAPKEKEKEKPKPVPANTSNAAKAILEKYMKRPRGG